MGIPGVGYTREGDGTGILEGMGGRYTRGGGVGIPEGRQV